MKAAKSHEATDWIGITMGCLWGLGSLVTVSLLGVLASEQQHPQPFAANVNTPASSPDHEPGTL